MNKWPADDFVRALVSQFPLVKPLLSEHLADNCGELLPHVFFGDLTRWIVAALETNPSSEAHGQAIRILEYLEGSLKQGDDDVQNLIAVSFLENLPYRSEPGVNIWEFLGPTLRKELKLQRGDQ